MLRERELHDNGPPRGVSSASQPHALDEAALLTYVDEHVSRLTWGVLPVKAAEPRVVAGVAAPIDLTDATNHRYVVLRESSSLPKATLRLPSRHHKLLAGGVIVHGKTVVTASYPQEPYGMEASDGGAASWVVEHLPLTRAAKVEIVVVAVYDPEGWLDTCVKQTSWHSLSQKAKDAAVYRYTGAHHPHHGDAQMVAVAMLNCPKADDGEDHGGAHEGEHLASRTDNPWVLVGGGCASQCPIVACGPEWHRVWRVAAEPNDALTCYSISLRMSAEFFRARRRQQRHDGSHVPSAGGGGSSDLDDASTRWNVRRGSTMSDGDRSSSIDFASVRSPTLHRVDTREGVAEFTETVRSLRSTLGGNAVGSDLDTAASSVAFETVEAFGLYAGAASLETPASSVPSTQPTIPGERRQLVTCESGGGGADQRGTHHSTRHPTSQPEVASGLHARLDHQEDVLALGGAVRGRAGQHTQRQLLPAGRADQATRPDAHKPQRLVVASLGPMGQWTVQLPEPYGSMSALFRYCEHQDPAVLHALLRRHHTDSKGLSSRRTTTTPGATSGRLHITPRHRVGEQPTPLSAISDNASSARPRPTSGARSGSASKPQSWKR